MYAVAGIVMGAVWVLGSDTPAWEHALRLVALVVCAGAAMTLVHRRRVRLGRPADHRLHAGLLLAKILLVVAALVLDGVLGLWLSEPSVITAVALTVSIAAGGPALHRWLSGKASGAGAGAGAGHGPGPGPGPGSRVPCRTGSLGGA
ncbi:hypothetical protein [Streptomyces sp. NPDC090022]|uniref:hypothetical protein n=1 Tax=Streptomyces sp. NPDC090022 TaxID=3365920 RepID=UPI00381C203C